MSEKKPEAGEWWFNADGERVYVIGTRSDGRYMFENNQNRIWPWCGDWSEWHQVPECTGWDWQPKPVESPDDWVTQDRLLVRAGVDEFRWMMNGMPQFDWHPCEILHRHGRGKLIHGHIDDAGGIGKYHLEVRCRRKDLPPLPEKTRRVQILEVVYGNRHGTEQFAMICESEMDAWATAWHYVHVVGTRTVEVPV